MDMASILKM